MVRGRRSVVPAAALWDFGDVHSAVEVDAAMAAAPRANTHVEEVLSRGH